MSTKLVRILKEAQSEQIVLHLVSDKEHFVINGLNVESFIQVLRKSINLHDELTITIDSRKNPCS